MDWRFEGSWVILVSGTAAGLALIVWSLHRAWTQHRRRDVVEVWQEQHVSPPEPRQAPVEEPAAAVTEPAAEVGETEMAPASQKIDGIEGLLFAMGAHMYELKAEAEDVPPIQIRRRPRRGPADEQLLLWPDADDPPAEPDQPAAIAAT